MEKSKPLNVIVTGATGMVGEGVLKECLENENVGSVLVAVRKPTGFFHPRMKEVIIPDFMKLSSVEKELTGYDACFFCLGVSSVGMEKEEYHRLTYQLTMNFAETLSKNNPGMTFCYISGAGTDSSEKGKIYWARVKGKTENDLKKLPFKAAWNFRPGIIAAGKGNRYTLNYYKYFQWLIFLIKTFYPGGILSLGEIGKAMINASLQGYEKDPLEVKDIKALAKR
jgi:uncharacterized protein YbjT (DUF2867 family)